MTTGSGQDPNQRNDPPAAPGLLMQFEQAEFSPAGDPALLPGQPAMACQSCHSALTDQYYVSGQTILCPNCHQQMLAAATGGSRFGRLMRATFFGVIAGFAGMLIWLGVRKLTGYEVGLIAIVVGLMVGGAVRAGSNGRGGVGYQLLAVFLTYCSIAANYIPDIYQALREEALKSDTAQVSENSSTSPQAAGGSTSGPATAEASVLAASGDEFDLENMGPVAKVVMAGLLIVLVIVLALAAPILGGVQNLIGLLIIGFALWEAWKINKSQQLSFTGPHQVRPPTAEGAPGAA